MNALAVVARRDDPHVLTWADLMAEPADPPPTIRPGVPADGVTVLAGPPKAGKTLLASQWAIESRRPALLVIEEGSLGSLRSRMAKQAEALGVTKPPIRFVHRRRVRLDNRDSIDWILAQCEDAELVVCDPLNRLHSADENRPTEMTRVMDGLAEIGQGRAVLAIHHLAKPSAERRGDPWDRFRGASSIRSGTDANLILETNGERMHLIGEFRDAEPLSQWLELDRSTLLFGPSDPPEAPTKVDAFALRAFVEERTVVTGRQVQDRFGVSRNTAFAALRALGCDEFSGARNVLSFSLGTRQ